MVFVGIYSKHKLVLESITAYLSKYNDIKPVVAVTDKTELYNKLKYHVVHVLIVNEFGISTAEQNMIIDLHTKFPKVKILLLSQNNRDDVVLRTIKSGANGYITFDSAGADLAKAIFMLRMGHDYFSETITQLLVNRYAADIAPSDTNDDNAEVLSIRQVEILKLWGDGYSNQQIADKLFLSVRTVETHKNHIMQKLNFKNSVDLIKYAIRNDIIKL